MTTDAQIAALFWAVAVPTIFIGVLLIGAFAVEWWLSGAMRRRAARRRMIERYCRMEWR